MRVLVGSSISEEYSALDDLPRAILEHKRFNRSKLTLLVVQNDDPLWECVLAPFPASVRLSMVAESVQV